MNLAVLGMLLTCTGTFLTALGYVIIKFGLNRAEEQKRPFYKVFLWWIGFSVMAGSQLVNVVSLGMAD